MQRNILVSSLTLLLLLSMVQTVFAASRSDLPRPAGIEPAIQFWTRVYTEIDTRHGFLHDIWDLNVVYRTVELPLPGSYRSNDSYIRDIKKHYSTILNTLGKGKRTGLTREERQVLELWPSNVSNATLLDAAGNIRFQLGQSDRFRAGLIRSGAWRGYIEATLKRMGLPQELVALPHVESSYNPEAYSHVGASGMWQFTHSTGQRFLRVDHIVDERNDPYKATVAAAQLLEYNYSITNNWALAITAYNHGVAGMRRAKKALGTDDIASIIRNYRSRTFGFASRNFYASFLAAVDVDTRAEHYFGSLERDSEPFFEIVELPAYVSMASLTKVLGVDMQELRQINRSLQPAVWSGEKYVPRGFKLNVPYEGKDAAGYAKRAIATISQAALYAAQKPDVLHKVRQGETISTIAARYKVSQQQLAQLNNLQNRNHIRIGQTLRLPQVTGAVAAVSSTGQKQGAIPDDGLYRVSSGDTLSEIATRYNISASNLMEFNRIDNEQRIFPGQVLRLKAPKIKQIVSNAAAIQLAASSEEKAEDLLDAELSPANDGQLTEGVIAQVESAEPTSAEEVALLGPALTPGAHPAASVDPSDYSVEQDNTIEVQAVETLGHYAEWLDLRASRLREVNRLRFGEALVIGKRIKLDFSSVSEARFVERRTRYHRDLQEEFFARNRIEDTQIHTVRGGDSLWSLAQTRYRVPVWLLRQYNPDIKLDSVKPGTQVVFPLIKYTGNVGDSNTKDEKPQLS